MREAAWLIEAACATLAEQMCALPPDEAERWVRLAQLEVSARVEQGVRDHRVLVLVHRARLPAFEFTPDAVDLVDLAPPLDEPPIEELAAEAVDFIEVQLVDARGKPRPSVRYTLQCPDGSTLQGTTDADGMLRHDRLACGGDCVLVLPEVDKEAA